MAEREPGPYWVRDRFNDDWVIALWNGSAWQLHGETTDYSDGAFLQIGPRAEMPPLAIDMPQPQMVPLDLNTPEGRRGLRALAAALHLPEWPEPQPITDAQKTGEQFLVWCDTPDPGEWLIARWNTVENNGWVGYYPWEFQPRGLIAADRFTHYLPLPPDMKPD